MKKSGWVEVDRLTWGSKLAAMLSDGGDQVSGGDLFSGGSFSEWGIGGVAQLRSENRNGAVLYFEFVPSE